MRDDTVVGENEGAKAIEAGRVTGFWHAGVTVSNMECSLRFYRDALGLEEVSATRLDGAYASPVVGLLPASILAVFLRAPGSEVFIELFEYQGIERHSASCRPCDFGSGHFCLYVDDVDAMFARLVNAGFSTRGPVVQLASGPRSGARVVYAIDPDGYHVELYQRAPTPARA